MYCNCMPPVESDRHRKADPAPSGPPPMPRWVKAFIAAVVILVLLFVASLLLGVEHGPGRHASGGSVAGLVAQAQEAARR